MPTQLGPSYSYYKINLKKYVDNWIPVTDYLPEYYELVLLREGDEKPVKGWWNGNGWDGLRVNKKKYTFWKKL
jgi:hypothetical protein